MNIIYIVIFLILFYYIKTYFFKYNGKNSLDGPFPIPILGNVYNLAMSSSPLNGMTELSLKYSHVFRLWMGDSYFTVISDPELVREVLVNNFPNFKDRPIANSVLYGTEKYAVTTSNGQIWDHNRAIMNKYFSKFINKSIDPFLFKKFNELMDLMEKRNNNKNEKVFNVHDIRFYLQCFTSATILKIVLNEDFNVEENTQFFVDMTSSLHNVFEKFQLYCASMNIFTFLQPILTKYVKVINKNNYPYFEFFKKKYSEHLGEIKFDENDQVINPKDMMDILINDNGKLNSNKEELEEIFYHFTDLFLAGAETTASAFEWIIIHLVNDKEFQEKIYNELKSLNKKEITCEDKLNTPLFNSFVKECFRYHPIAPLGVPHVSSNDLTIKYKDRKIFFPKDSSIIVNFKALAFNENVFKNPTKFIPDRFIMNKNESEYVMLFSVGGRNCPGSSLALKEIFIFISNLILKYKFDSIDGCPIDETELLSLTLQPNKFNLKITKRN